MQIQIAEMEKTKAAAKNLLEEQIESKTNEIKDLKTTNFQMKNALERMTGASRVETGVIN